jgi:hypothetical protein
MLNNDDSYNYDLKYLMFYDSQSNIYVGFRTADTPFYSNMY